MHSRGVAHRFVFHLAMRVDVDITLSLLSHRDCSLKNVLMDATHMYPLDFIPCMMFSWTM
jgi:hypothetical protein